MTAYLDHAATTPMHPSALAAMVEQMGRTGNPSSLHGAGRAARRVVEESRELLAERLGARPSEVIWTAGGTEADNLAIKGLYWARVSADPSRRRVLVSAVEHHAVLDPAGWLASGTAGPAADVVRLPADRNGRLDLAALEAELALHGDEVALISVMWANNEIGTVQPVGQVVELARRYGIPVHCDAVQAVGQVPVDFAASGVDAMTITAHKAGGPVGVGALLARRGLGLTPVLHGGGQERAVRSGTLDTPAIRAFAVAADIAVRDQPEESVRLARLRDELVAGVRAVVPEARLTGPEPVAPTGDDAPGDMAATPDRLPANAHFTFPGCEGDSLLYLLDSRGICCSTGSACQAGVPQPSHVLLATGMDQADARGALRFSLGATSTRADVDELVTALPEVVQRARAAGLAASS